MNRSTDFRKRPKEEVMSNKWTKVLLSLLSILGLFACAQPATPLSAPPTQTVVQTAPPASSTKPGGNYRTFVIMPEESRASYIVDEEFFSAALNKLGIPPGKVKVTGSTQAIEGFLQLNLADLSAPLGENRITVRINTLATDRDDRDRWIREKGPRLNDYPLATFVATAIADAPASYTEGEEVRFKLIGDLTIREITKTVTFEVTASLSGDTLRGVARTRLLMSDFGIEPPSFANTLTVADEFELEIQITAREQ
jgi:polyisoprenoid-binding protein YceI